MSSHFMNNNKQYHSNLEKFYPTLTRQDKENDSSYANAMATRLNHHQNNKPKAKCLRHSEEQRCSQPRKSVETSREEINKSLRKRLDSIKSRLELEDITNISNINQSFGPSEKPHPHQISVSEIEDTPFRQKYLSRHNETINDSVVQAVLFGIDGLGGPSPKLEQPLLPPPAAAQNVVQNQENTQRKSTIETINSEEHHQAFQTIFSSRKDSSSMAEPPTSINQRRVSLEKGTGTGKKVLKNALKSTEKKKAHPIKIDFLKEYIDKINSYKQDNQQLSSRVTSLQSDNEQLKDRLLNLENELHSLRETKKQDNASSSNYNSQERNLLVSYLSGSFENKISAPPSDQPKSTKHRISSDLETNEKSILESKDEEIKDLKARMGLLGDEIDILRKKNGLLTDRNSQLEIRVHDLNHKFSLSETIITESDKKIAEQQKEISMWKDKLRGLIHNYHPVLSKIKEENAKLRSEVYLNYNRLTTEITSVLKQLKHPERKGTIGKKDSKNFEEQAKPKLRPSSAQPTRKVKTTKK